MDEIDGTRIAGRGESTARGEEKMLEVDMSQEEAVVVERKGGGVSSILELLLCSEREREFKKN